MQSKRSWKDWLATVPETATLEDLLKALPPKERRAALEGLPPGYVEAIDSNPWLLEARRNQRAPGTPFAASDRTDWTFWLLLAGRGFGKTRTGAEQTCTWAKEYPGCHIALCGPTADDTRKTMLSAGLETNPQASGILKVAPKDFYPRYEPSKRTLTWPNGSVGTLYSGEEPERFRGPQHHFAWVDELPAFQRAADTWDMLMMGLRLGERPQAVVTSTPRPTPLMKAILADPATVVSRGSTYDNQRNLAPSWFRSIIHKYEGTRLGRQELNAELLDDVPGALWKLGLIDALRVPEAPPRLYRVTVGVDPAVTARADSDETGIIVCGVGPCPYCPPEPNGSAPTHGFVLADGSGVYSPSEWAREVIAYYRRHKADRVVAEVNQGGDLVEANIRTVDRGVSYLGVRAARGKQVRAEPIAALYEQGRVHHVGAHPRLEDQMCTWDPAAGDDSPDRMDALVWGLTYLMLDNGDCGAVDYRGGERGDFGRASSRDSSRDWSAY